MTTPRDVRRTALIGRRVEQRVLTELLAGARRGRSRVLVIRGEAGIGKTVLVTEAIFEASDFHVIQIGGAESEMELPYAGVQQLCAPLLSRLNRLPPPQRSALQVALGLRKGSSGAIPDRLLVGLAVLTLLGDVASENPVICLIDDAQWVDDASLNTLAFVARRILADPVAMIFVAREPWADRQVAGFPELELRGLDEAHARALFATNVPGRIDEHVRETIIAEAAGNPLALMELHKALTPAELAGGYGLAKANSRATRIEAAFEHRLRELPSDTTTLLLLAAAEPAGISEWLWAAAERLGVAKAAIRPAVEGGLVTADAGIRFRHPLIRSAVYRSAPVAERRRAHAALAQSITETGAGDHRSWHRAHAASRPDEQLALDLVRSSEGARARGGAAAAAAFLAYAADLTPDPVMRAHRMLDAANAKLDAGAPSAASQLMVDAAADNDTEFIGARIALLRAKLAFAIKRGRDAPPLLVAAAEQVRHISPLLAREAYLEALMASLIVGGLARDDHSTARAVAVAAQDAPTAPDPPRAIDLMLDGLIVRLTDGYVSAAPLLRRALDEYLREDEAGIADPRWHGITHRVCLDLFDRDASELLAEVQIEKLRAAGELTVLPAVLYQYAGLRITAGRFDQAMALVEEAEVIIAATGAPPQPSIRPYLAAYRGQEGLCLKLVQTAIEDASARGEGAEVAVALCAKAILHNGLGQYSDALEACAPVGRIGDVGYYSYALVEMVEAASRCGQGHVAADGLDRLNERAQASRTASALGLAARCAALVAGDASSADTDYRAAIDHLQRGGYALYLARTHLVYGEWLRRVRRRATARSQLRIACDMFTEMGAAGFADRARRELMATGETVHSRSANVVVELTTQESRIATLARDGYTTPEIAGQLFLSPRTVEWHLSRIFIKLGITSRRELRSAAFESSP